MNSAVQYDRDAAVAIIRLNRPEARNAFDAAMRKGLKEAIDRAEADKSVRAIVIEGAGKSFSSGADLLEPLPDDFDVRDQLNGEYLPVVMAITRSCKPYIAAVNGAAAGIGCALAMACDLTMMAEDAYYLQAFALIGLVPDGGTCWQLVRQIGRRRAFDLITSGERISAARCLDLGLANRVVFAAALHDDALAWAHRLGDQAPRSVASAKAVLSRAGNMTLEESMREEAELQHSAIQSSDFGEGRRAFAEKRAPRFTGQ